MGIESSVFVGARGKVSSCNESYVWVPKYESLVKLQEVGNFPTWVIFSLKTNNGIGFLKGRDWPCDLV